MGLKFTKVEESWPKPKYSNVTLLPTMVIPTPLVQEYRTATEGCKKTYKYMQSIPELPWDRGVQLLFAQNTPTRSIMYYKYIIINDGHWLWSSSWETRLECWTRQSADVDSGAVLSTSSWIDSKLRAKTQAELPGWEEHRSQDRHRSQQNRPDGAHVQPGRNCWCLLLLQNPNEQVTPSEKVTAIISRVKINQSC